MVARLGNGVTILAWLLLVHATTGSYARAASIGSANFIAVALAGPVAGRLADRFGAARILPYYGGAYSVTQLLLLGCVLAGAPHPLLLVLSALSGAVFPPLGPALRAAWTALTDERSGRSELRTAAMAAESTLFELIFVLGPLILAGCMLAAQRLPAVTEPGVAGPSAPLAGTALCAGIGTGLVARGRAMRELKPGSMTPTRGLGPLLTPGFPTMLVCAVGVAFSFGAAPVAIAAYAAVHDPAGGGSLTGLLIAVWSVGSAAAGFWYGTRRFATPEPRQFTRLLVGLSLGYWTWVLMPNPAGLGMILFLTGSVIAPVLTVQASLIAQMVPQRMLNEAYTWLTTTNLSCAALGSTAAGLLLDRTGRPSWGFIAAAIAAALAAAAATTSRSLRAVGRTSLPDAGFGQAAVEPAVRS